MMTQNHDETEIEQAFAAIRAFCNGQHVPAPPGYWEDKGDVMDCQRVAGWVAHALFVPDVDGDNVMRYYAYEPGRTRTLKIPGYGLLSDDNEVVDVSHLDTEGMSAVLQTCMQVISKTHDKISDVSQDRTSYVGMPRKVLPALADDIIAQIRTALVHNGGRMDAEGSWPRVSDQQAETAVSIVRTLVGEVTDNKMGMVYDNRLDRTTVLTYPVAGDTIADRDLAIYAISLISNSLQNISQAYRLRDSIKRDAVAKAKKDAEINQEIDETKAAMAAAFVDPLRARGDVASAFIASTLTKNLIFPVYRGTQRHPSPEKDKMIDALEELFGDAYRDMAKNIISSEPERKLDGMKKLNGLLETMFGDPHPSL